MGNVGKINCGLGINRFYIAVFLRTADLIHCVLCVVEEMLGKVESHKKAQKDAEKGRREVRL